MDSKMTPTSQTSHYFSIALRSLKIFSISLPFMLLGCGSDNENARQSPEPIEALPKGEFTAIEGLPNAKGLRLKHITSLKQGIQTADKGLILLGEASSELHRDSVGFLLKLDQQLNILTQASDELGYAGICQHNSGEYTLGKIVEVDEFIASNHLGVMLQRFSSEHQLLKETLLKDSLLEEYYEINFNLETWPETPFTISSNEETFSEIVFPGLNAHRFQPVTLHCSGENLLVAFNHYGKKISWYNDQLELQWSDTLMLDNYAGSRTSFAKAPKVFISDTGHVFAATNVNNFDIPAINHRFQLQLPEFNDYSSISDNIFLKQWTSLGQTVSSSLLGTEFLDDVSGIAMVDNSLWLTAKSHMKKFNQANHTFEWDISVFKLDPYTLNETEITNPIAIINVDQEDWLEGMNIFNNQLWLYGHNGYQQVDSNSYTSNPKGFYGYLDLTELTLNEVTSLEGPRATVIDALINTEDSIISLGITDGPITHTTDRSNQGFINQKILDLF